ncbi:mediator of RNA polymerase II transcription subunit 1-like [Sphaerodactylus townsendi]|uniref:mediator of RNA polymerase II transcription subunit 1-like n=1 Tax=Sphaerodactylus townsendi TaxID=933632 RepID=UPI0020266AB8|nr:mediator of RNA polymerase II transcription subunit 1-like [Sphaerodactylus townsendi]
MALFVPMKEEDGSIHPSVSEIQALEEWQEMGSFEPISTAAVMKRLRLKFSQKPWSETGKLVRACMNYALDSQQWVTKFPVTHLTGRMPRFTKRPSAVHIILGNDRANESLFAVMNKLEVISKQKRLHSRVSPDGTTFYITSEMFCIEIQFKADGDVLEVKLIQPGESPQIYEDMLLILRTKNYEAFGEVLEELVNLYQTSGKRETKARMYLALQSLEKDITSLSLLDRVPNEKRITKILCGKVGYLRSRIGGLQIPGMKAFVTIGGSDITHRLPLYPMIVDSWTEEAGCCYQKILIAFSGHFLSCSVVIEVLSSEEVRCTLRTISEDCDLNISNDFLTRVLKRCMSIPILMRAIFKKAPKQKPDETVQDLEELSDQTSPEASELAVSEGSGDSLQNEETSCETWSPSTAESLTEASSQASVSGTTEENSPSVESSDDSTEANTSSSSLLTSFWDMDII